MDGEGARALVGPDDRRQQRILRRPHHRGAEAHDGGGGEGLPRLADARDRERARGRDDEPGGDRVAGAEPVGERAAERVAREPGERDRGDGQRRDLELESAHLVQVDEQEGEREAAAERRQADASEQHPGVPRKRGHETLGGAHLRSAADDVSLCCRLMPLRTTVSLCCRFMPLRTSVSLCWRLMPLRTTVSLCCMVMPLRTSASVVAGRHGLLLCLAAIAFSMVRVCPAGSLSFAVKRMESRVPALAAASARAA